jgi:hypothetical protein
MPFEARSVRPGCPDQIVEFALGSIRRDYRAAFGEESQAHCASEAAGAASDQI